MIVYHIGKKPINAINNLVVTDENVTSEGGADSIVTPDTVHESIVKTYTVVSNQTTLLHISDLPDILDTVGDDIVKADGEGDDTANVLGAMQI